MSKISDFLAKAAIDIEEVAAWIKGKEPIVLNATQIAMRASNAFIDAAKSPEGIIVENIISSFVPQAKAWTSDAITLATLFGKSMQKIQDNIPAVEGVALRFSAELVLLIKKASGISTSIDEEILNIQKMFVKPTAPTTTSA